MPHSAKRTRRRHHWSEPEARAVLDDFTASGLTTTAFCAQRGLSRGRLHYWQRRLSLTPSPRTPAFVALALPSPARADAHIEILRGAVVLRVREDIDVDHLARLVTALAERSPC